MEEYLEKTVQMFSYLTDKDLFAEIYRNQLAKRLLNQRSASDEMERLMIGKLKLRYCALLFYILSSYLSCATVLLFTFAMYSQL